jgi:hypothetical protein
MQIFLNINQHKFEELVSIVEFKIFFDFVRIVT